MIKTLIVILLSFAIVSCGKKENTENIPDEKKDSTSQIKKESNEKGNIQGQSDTNKYKSPELKWEFKTLGEGTYGVPITEVYLVVAKNKILIEKIEFGFSEFVKSNYTDYHIPDSALIACRGWWAGAGIDYWVIKTSGGYEVYSREIGETVTESGEPGDFEGKPKKIKTINAK